MHVCEEWRSFWESELLQFGLFLGCHFIFHSYFHPSVVQLNCGCMDINILRIRVWTRFGPNKRTVWCSLLTKLQFLCLKFSSIDLPCCGFECVCTLQCHEAITKRIPDWLASCSEPNELPDESAILLEVCT